MKLRFLMTLALICTFAVYAPMVAAEDIDYETTQEFTGENFLNLLAMVRSDLEQDNPRALTRREWRDFERIESQFQRKLRNVDHVDNLEDERRLELQTLHNELKALLQQDDPGDRIVCTTRRRTGSRIRQQECMTQREHDARKLSNEMLAPFFTPPAFTNSGGSQ